MRDPARIDKILSMLKTYWKSNPDLRFVQMVISIIGDGDCFYLEDEDFIKFLHDAMRRHTAPQ